MGLSNDERGWVMTSLSGLACVVGAAVICVDIIIRQLPSKRNFRIQDSDAFLSTSLSLSFGVMLFSALFSMLPSSKQSLKDGGFSSKEASWTMIASFIGGIIGIQLVSRILHRFIPSHVVDCEHTHAEGRKKEDLTLDGDEPTHKQGLEHDHNPIPPTRKHPRTSRRGSHARHDNDLTIPSQRSGRIHQSSARAKTFHTPSYAPERPDSEQDRTSRPSLSKRLTSTLSHLTTGTKGQCGDDCYGYTQPCGADCFKNMTVRAESRAGSATRLSTSRSRLVHSASETSPLLQNVEEDRGQFIQDAQVTYRTDHVHDFQHNGDGFRDESSATYVPTDNTTTPRSENPVDDDPSPSEHHHHHHHHHHVPSNAFLSIGLQTSIAIALHKLPEGFITYATNHANPKLGVSVFLALFIHNISEGFAMALPLYLALQSRTKAMLISFVLGGLTQPLGAGLAALWFKIAGKGEWAPSEAVYGGMFAVTAGIMASVALQLFSEALGLTHSRSLCMVGAFAGMAIMGISSALTA